MVDETVIRLTLAEGVGHRLSIPKDCFGRRGMVLSGKIADLSVFWPFTLKTAVRMTPKIILVITKITAVVTKTILGVTKTPAVVTTGTAVVTKTSVVITAIILGVTKTSVVITVIILVVTKTPVVVTKTPAVVTTGTAVVTKTFGVITKTISGVTEMPAVTAGMAGRLVPERPVVAVKASSPIAFGDWTSQWTAVASRVALFTPAGAGR